MGSEHPDQTAGVQVFDCQARQVASPDTRHRADDFNHRLFPGNGQRNHPGQRGHGDAGWKLGEQAEFRGDM